MGRPNCAAWEFDTGSEGWVIDPNAEGPGRNASSGAPIRSTALRFSGTAAVGFPINAVAGSTAANELLVKVKLCTNGEANNLNGKTLRARIHFEPPPPDNNQGHLVVLYGDSSLTLASARLSGEFVVSTITGGGPVFGADEPWLPFEFPILDDIPVAGIGFLFAIGPYTGTIFLDSVSIF